MHSSRMRTVRSSSRLSRGGLCLSACWDTTPPGAETPPWSRPPRADTRPQDQAHTPQSRPPPRDQAQPHLVDRQTSVKT